MKTNLMKEIKEEYSKVIWPNKEELKDATMLVALISIAISIYLGVFDLAASRLLDLLVSVVGG